MVRGKKYHITDRAFEEIYEAQFLVGYVVISKYGSDALSDNQFCQIENTLERPSGLFSNLTNNAFHDIRIIVGIRVIFAFDSRLVPTFRKLVTTVS